MKFRMPAGSKSLSVSVEGKQSPVKDGMVEIADTIPARTLVHLVSGLGWLCSDPVSTRRYREATGEPPTEVKVEEAVAEQAAKDPEVAKRVEAINQKR